MLELIGQIFQLFTDLIPRPIKIGPTERGVRVRHWGDAEVEVIEPGLHIYLPIMTGIEIYPVNSQLIETAILVAESHDGVNYQTRIAVEYEIDDPEAYFFQSHDSQLHLEMVAGATLISVVNDYDSSDFREMGSRAVCRKVRDRIRERLRSRGVRILAVRPVMFSTCIPVFTSEAERLAD